MGIIYLVTSPSGKRYIGLTKQAVNRRWRRHVNDSKNCKNLQKWALQFAIQKYGEESFLVEVIHEENDYEKLKELEKHYIKLHNTKAPNGYNLTDGGDGVINVIYTEESRKRRSLAQLKSFQDPVRKQRHLESQQRPEVKQARSEKSKYYAQLNKEKLSEIMKEKWKDREFVSKMKSRWHKPKINDGLTKCQRYRLKDLEEYRRRKREYAKTPEQQLKRSEYYQKYKLKQHG